MKLEKKLRYFRESKIETEIKRETRESERQRQRDRHDLEPKGHRWRWTVKVEQLKVDGRENDLEPKQFYHTDDLLNS